MKGRKEGRKREMGGAANDVLSLSLNWGSKLMPIQRYLKSTTRN